MKTHHAQSDDLTRSAKATGRLVVFYRRKRIGGSVSERLRVWREAYQNHDLAKAAADAWAHETKIH